MGSSPSGSRLQKLKEYPNYKDGLFQNLEPTEVLHPDASRFGIFWDFLFNKPATTRPAKPLSVIPLTKKKLENVSHNLRVIWLGHSTFLLQFGKRNILIDPIFSDRASPFSWVGPKRFSPVPIQIEDLPKIDAVIISHDHYDHLDHKSIVKLQHKTNVFLVPAGVGAHLEYWGIPESKIAELYWWESIAFHEMEYVCTPARHFSGRGPFDRQETLWASWVIKNSRFKVYYSGDTGPHQELKRIGNRYGPFDVTLIQIGAYNRRWPYIHMTPKEGLEAHIALQGRLFIPAHWGTFDLGMHPWYEPRNKALRLGKKMGVQTYVPIVGQVLTLQGGAKAP